MKENNEKHFLKNKSVSKIPCVVFPLSFSAFFCLLVSVF